MIYKKCQSSSSSQTIIRYIFGAKIKDAEKRPDIEFLGGNILSKTPFSDYNTHNGHTIRAVDTRSIEKEFNGKMSLYHGAGEKLIEHHVLSLPAQDSLSDADFKAATTEFLRQIGVDASMTWVAARHNDSEHSHVHIALCRVQLKNASDGTPMHYGLLPDKNDYERGMEAVRVIEKTFFLTPTPSPGENSNNKNQASIIRAIGKSLLSEPNQTFTGFICELAKRGVEVKPSINSQGNIEGLSYRLNCLDGRWISGSKIMATKMTFGALSKILKYSQARDEAILGAGINSAPPAVASFERMKTVSFGIATATKNISDSAKNLFVKSPYFYIDVRKNDFLIGFKISYQLYPSTNKHSGTSTKNWENLVITITRQMMTLLRESVRYTPFTVLEMPFSTNGSIATKNISNVHWDRLDEILGNFKKEFIDNKRLNALIAHISEALSTPTSPHWDKLTYQQQQPTR